MHVYCIFCGTRNYTGLSASLPLSHSREFYALKNYVHYKVCGFRNCLSAFLPSIGGTLCFVYVCIVSVDKSSQLAQPRHVSEGCGQLPCSEFGV